MKPHAGDDASRGPFYSIAGVPKCRDTRSVDTETYIGILPRIIPWLRRVPEIGAAKYVTCCVPVARSNFSNYPNILNLVDARNCGVSVHGTTDSWITASAGCRCARIVHSSYALLSINAIYRIDEVLRREMRTEEALA